MGFFLDPKFVKAPLSRASSLGNLNFLNSGSLSDK